MPKKEILETHEILESDKRPTKIKSTGKHGIFADRNNPTLISPKRARAALPILIRCAQCSDTITFRELADAIAAPDMINRTMSPVLDCINKGMENLSEHPNWMYDDIPTLTTIVVVAGGGPSGWMRQQMVEQLGLEPTRENYQAYCIEPVHEYKHWKEVMDEIIRSQEW